MSWNQLLDIYQQNADFVQSGRDIEALVCRNDGEPLRTGPNGEWYCPFDGYRPMNDPASDR